MLEDKIMFELKAPKEFGKMPSFFGTIDEVNEVVSYSLKEERFEVPDYVNHILPRGHIATIGNKMDGFFELYLLKASGYMTPKGKFVYWYAISDLIDNDYWWSNDCEAMLDVERMMRIGAFAQAHRRIKDVAHNIDKLDLVKECLDGKPVYYEMGNLPLWNMLQLQPDKNKPYRVDQKTFKVYPQAVDFD